MTVDTKQVIGRRLLHFESLDEVLAEAERLAAGRHRELGNWTLGQILMHLARADDVSIDGTPDRPGWLFIKSADGKMTRPRWFLRIFGVLTVPLLKWFLRRGGPPPGIRPPAFFWKEVAALTPKEGLTTEDGRAAARTWAEVEAVSIANPVSTEVGLAALRKATSRLKSESNRDLEGIMTRETFNLYHLRHAEMHLSFIIPEGGEGQAASVVGQSALARLFVFVINTLNRCAERICNAPRPADRSNTRRGGHTVRNDVFISALAVAVFCSACQRQAPPAAQVINVSPPLYALEVEQQDGKVTSLSASEPITITPSGIFQGVNNLDASLDPGNQLTIKDGTVVANGKDGGQVQPGDSVRLEKDGRLFVNGQERSLREMPQQPTDPNGNRVISSTGGTLNVWRGSVVQPIDVPGVPLKVVDNDGAAALQFKRWNDAAGGVLPPYSVVAPEATALGSFVVRRQRLGDVVWILVFEGIPAKSVPVGVSTLDAQVLVSTSEFEKVSLNGQTISSSSSPSASWASRCTLSVNADGSTSTQGPQQPNDEPSNPGRLDIWLDNLKPDVNNPSLGWTIQKAQIGELKVSSWDVDSIIVSDCKFKFADGGKKLVCPDQTYEAADTPKIIIISKNGMTREQADR